MKEMEDLTQSTEEASVLRWGYSLCLQLLPLLFLADPDFYSTLQLFSQEISPNYSLPSTARSCGILYAPSWPYVHHNHYPLNG